MVGGGNEIGSTTLSGATSPKAIVTRKPDVERRVHMGFLDEDEVVAVKGKEMEKLRNFGTKTSSVPLEDPEIMERGGARSGIEDELTRCRLDGRDAAGRDTGDGRLMRRGVGGDGGRLTKRQGRGDDGRLTRRGG